MDRIEQLQDRRARAIEAGRAITAKAAAENNRDLTVEERAALTKALDDADSLKAEIRAEERLIEMETETRRGAAEREIRSGRAQGGSQPRGSDGGAAFPLVSDAVRAELRSLYMRSYMSGNFAGPPITDAERARIGSIRSELSLTAEHRAFNIGLGWNSIRSNGDKGEFDRAKDFLIEHRDLFAGSDPAGGFMIPPEDYRAELIRKLDDLVYVRSMATKFMVTQAQDLGIPTLETNPADSDWTSELAVGSDDTALNFGKRQFAPHPLAKFIKVSNKLLRQSVMPVEEIVRDRFAYKFGITQEKGFLLGTGAGQPLGLFTASSAGISTSRDYTTAATAVLSADDLVGCFYNLKAAYRREASWLFNRTIIQKIMLMKDGDGQYLWKQGLQGGQPDLILGRPVAESEYVPNTYSTGQYVGMFGVYRFYYIADALDMTVQRLDELYAATNQTGFIMRMETDGMPVLEEPFSRLKLA